MPTENENTEFWAKVDEFRSKADEFYTEYQRLRAMRQQAARDPETLKEWNALIGEAENVQAKVSDVERAIAEAREWVGGFFGVENMRNGMHDNNLGLAPFAIALVAGAIAWLGTWLSKAYQLDRKLTYQENLIAQGIDPATAARTAREEEGGFMTALGGEIGRGLALATIVGVAIFFILQSKPRG